MSKGLKAYRSKRAIFAWKIGTKVVKNGSGQIQSSRTLLNVSGNILTLGCDGTCEGTSDEGFQLGQIVITQEGWRGINI